MDITSWTANKYTRQVAARLTIQFEGISMKKIRNILCRNIGTPIHKLHNLNQDMSNATSYNHKYSIIGRNVTRLSGGDMEKYMEGEVKIRDEDQVIFGLPDQLLFHLWNRI